MPEEEEKEPLTLQDIMIKRAFDLERLRFEREKADSGCVIRSLESALGTLATDEEWKIRLDDARNAKDIWALAFEYPDPQDLQKAILRESEANNARILEMISEFSAHNSPLGNALKKVNMEQLKLTQQGIKDTIKTGAKICIISMLHMAHLGESPDGKIISQSDGGQPVIMDDKKAYNVLVFSLKEDINPTPAVK